MKKVFGLILSFVFLLASCSTAQLGSYSTSNKKAIKYFEEALEINRKVDPQTGEKDYEAIIELLNKAIDKDEDFAEAHRFLGNTYAENGEGEKAVKSFETAIQKKPNISPTGLIHFEIARTAFYYGLYEDAKKHATYFIKHRNANPDYIASAREIHDNAAFAIEAMKNPVDFEPFNLGNRINTAAPEYFPTITTDDKTLLYTRMVDDQRNPYGKQEDFFVTHQKEDGSWETGYSISGVINTPFNEGAPSFNPDGKSLVFVACEDQNLAPNPRVPYYGENREGYGSCDLFITEKVGDEWTPAKNLSPNVNTWHWETQPSVSADGKTIYFIRGIRERGYRGFKDQDIYVTRKQEDGTWSKAERIQGAVNTPGKEESVQIHPDGQTLYFTSDGHPGMGKTDIFVSRKKPDGTWGKPVNLGYPINTSADENSLLVSSSGEIAFFASDREGGFGDLDLYGFVLPKQHRPSYTNYLTGIVFEKGSEKPLSAYFELKDLKTEEVVVSSKSDPVNGEFLVALPTGRDYGLFVEKEGYNNYSENFTLTAPENNEAYTLKVPLVPIRVDKSDTIELANIFYDLDKATLRPESYVELKKLKSYLEKNPTLKIEIHGHTDNQGTEEHNQVLSENRAKSVYNYLIENGIAEDRLSFKGFGESIPKYDNDTEEGRQKNRRTEYVITGM